jgi:hypothetical protein
VLDLLDEALGHLEGAFDKLFLKGGESMAAMRCAVQSFGTVVKCAADAVGLLADVESRSRAQDMLDNGCNLAETLPSRSLLHDIFKLASQFEDMRHLETEEYRLDQPGNSTSEIETMLCIPTHHLESSHTSISLVIQIC